MSDLISRDEAIERVLGTGYADQIKDNMIFILRRLPTIEERNVGEWLDNGDRYYRCSLCGMKDTDNWKFCRGCGAYKIGDMI